MHHSHPETLTTDVAVLGGGPAGLAAALELARSGKSVVLFEREADFGGIARTIVHDGFRFDIGGHRFFTKVPEIEALWLSLLGDDLLIRTRRSRILYNGKFFDYPLRPWNTFSNLGLIESLLILASYLRGRLFPAGSDDTLEEWIVNRFGRRLFDMFFKVYTEKVWGLPCSAIKADWAGQRIRGLSLRSAVFNMIFPARNRGEIRTLIDRFYYPRLGPGMLWRKMADEIVRLGGQVFTEAEVRRLVCDGGRVTAVEAMTPAGPVTVSVAEVISSLPLDTLPRLFDPVPEQRIIGATGRLRYRDFLTVALFVDAPELFPDNWLYINSPGVRVGRIQNFKNWSPEMVPDPSMSCLGLEYFCFRGDDLWTMPDEALVELARHELATLGLIDASLVTGGAVVRMPKAYPIYDGRYEEGLAVLRTWLEGIPNLQMIGRNGMHRYNNMDHSMLTGILAVRNLAGERHDLWAINSTDDYCESPDR